MRFQERDQFLVSFTQLPEPHVPYLLGVRLELAIPGESFRDEPTSLSVLVDSRPNVLGLPMMVMVSRQLTKNNIDFMVRSTVVQNNEIFPVLSG